MELLDALSQWPGAGLLRRSSLAYLFVNAAHILSFGLLIGAIVALDLRLLGLFGREPLAPLGRVLSRMAFAGACLAVLTGFVLFTVRPTEYVSNPAFIVKFALLVLALLNAALATSSMAWQMALHGASPSAVLRVSALFSLLLWPSVLVAGRWIGFV